MRSQASFEIFSDRDSAHPKGILQEDRMQCLSSRLPGTLYLVGLFLTCLAPDLVAQGRRPGPVPLAAGGLQIISNTLVADTVPAESGPYNFTFTVKNTGTSSILVDETLCYDGIGQISCSTTPESFNLAPGATRLVTGTYYTLGNGVFQITEWAANADHSKWASALGGPITVTGAAPIASHVNPIGGGHLGNADTLYAALSHPSGINTSSVELRIDGVNKTGVATVTSTSVKASAQALSLSAGTHTWKTYACAVNGRCDTATSVFTSNPNPPAFVLDDSLPPPIGYLALQGILGGLPLPPISERGCATTTDHPEMLLSPGQVLAQPNPEGWVFAAGVVDTQSVPTIYVNYGDHVPGDGWPTCSTLTWASGFAWAYWVGADSTSSLWDYYPYSDSTQLFGAAAVTPSLELGLVGPRKPGPWRDHFVSAGGGSRGGAKALRAVSRPQRQRHLLWPTGGVGRKSMLRPPPGAIKYSSLQVSLNGVVIIANGTPVRTGVDTSTVGFAGGQAGLKITLSPTDTLWHYHNSSNPPAQQGGWNQVVASISDSTNHTTSVRARFVAIVPGPVSNIAVTALKDFRKLDMSECAAFGAFQCGGVMMVQSIPGFVSRDKERGLHLVYRSASQRARTVLPLKIYVNPLQKAPDSMKVVPKEDGVTRGGVTRYAGLKGSPAGQFVLPLNESAHEYRAVAAELDAAPGQAAIRNITSELTHYYPGEVPRSDTVSQPVVQLYLSDTTVTRFGAGWQLAELSRLVTGLTWQGTPWLIWLNGDGSYSIFTKPGSSWLSPLGETASLIENTSVTNPDSARYTIRLDNGATVGFRIDGWQTWTSDLIGNRTYYSYTGTGIKRLQFITDPNGTRFEFGYMAGSGGKVETIGIKPSGGTVRTAATLKYGPGGRLDTLIVHWGYGVRDTTRFGYESDATLGYFLTSVTDPRHTPVKPVVTTFAYDSVLKTPTTMTLPPDNIGVQRQQFYRDFGRRASPRPGKGRGSQPLDRTVLISQMLGTSVNPAGYATDYSADRYGGPIFVRRVSPGDSPPGGGGGFLLDTVYKHDDRHIERDSLGRVVKIVHMRDSATVADSVMYRYDTRNRLDRIIRNTLEYPVPASSLDTLAFTYDSVSISTTDNPGAWCYRLRAATDGSGGTTAIAYGTTPTPALCKPTLVVGVALDTTWFTYGGGAFTKNNAIAGRPTTITQPTGVATDIGYHASTWNTGSYYQPGKLATTTVYYSGTSNGLGRPDSVIDPEGKRQVFWYDSLGRIRYQKGGSGSLAPTTFAKYGRGGLVDSIVVFAMSSHDTIPIGSPVRQATKYFYDRLGRPDSVVNPGGTRRIWYKGRDPYGNPTVTYGGNGSYSANVTDWQGRTAISILGPVLPWVSYDGLGHFADTYSSGQYNAAGALTSGQLSDGQTYTSTYDVKGRLRETVHAEATGTMSIRRRGYSRTGQLVADSLTFPQAGFRIMRYYKYNRRGQRIEATDTVKLLAGGTLKGDWRGRINYIYDIRSRLDSIRAYSDSSGASLEFARIKIVRNRGNRDSIVNIQLNPTGSPNSTLTTEIRFDAAGRLSYYKSKKLGGGSDFAASTAITYNKVDDALSLTSTTPAASGVPMTYTYSTDGTRRLASEVAAGGLSTTWAYDVFGNRVKQATGSVDTSAHEATDNRLRYRRRTVGSNAHWYWHDHTGARIGSTDTLNGTATLDSRMTYTAAGQLAWSLHRNNPGDLLSYFTSTWNWYDASGMREMTEVKQTGLGGYLLLYPGYGRQSYYFYDGSDVALIVERDSAGVLTVAKRYVTGGLDRQLAVKNKVGGYVGSLAIVADRLGSVQGAMKPDGNLEATVVSYSTTAYGEVTGTTGSGGTSLDVGFAGASSPDPKGGFTYMRNRWYDPQTGRFLTQDPIGLAGGVNLYAYAGNNPIAFSDPYGLDCRPSDWACQVYKAGMQVLGFMAGFAHGAGLGGGIGSVVPGVGTLAGAAVGGLAEGTLGALAAGEFVDATYYMSSDDGAARSGQSSGQGAKSADQYDKHQQVVSEMRDRLGGLRDRLKAVKGPKAQEPLREQIRRLERDIAGHEKEIQQKWPDGRPE